MMERNRREKIVKTEKSRSWPRVDQIWWRQLRFLLIPGDIRLRKDLTEKGVMLALEGVERPVQARSEQGPSKDKEETAGCWKIRPFWNNRRFKI